MTGSWWESLSIPTSRHSDIDFFRFKLPERQRKRNRWRLNHRNARQGKQLAAEISSPNTKNWWPQPLKPYLYTSSAYSSAGSARTESSEMVPVGLMKVNV